MPRRFQETENDILHKNLVAFVHRNEVKLSAGTRTEVNLRAGAGGEFMMPGNKIGVAMCLDDVLDLESESSGLVEVDVDVALRIDHSGFRPRPNEIGSVRKTTQIELSEIHGLRL